MAYKLSEETKKQINQTKTQTETTGTNKYQLSDYSKSLIGIKSGITASPTSAKEYADYDQKVAEGKAAYENDMSLSNLKENAEGGFIKSRMNASLANMNDKVSTWSEDEQNDFYYSYANDKEAALKGRDTIQEMIENEKFQEKVDKWEKGIEIADKVMDVAQWIRNPIAGAINTFAKDKETEKVANTAAVSIATGMLGIFDYAARGIEYLQYGGDVPIESKAGNGPLAFGAISQELNERNIKRIAEANPEHNVEQFDSFSDAWNSGNGVFSKIKNSVAYAAGIENIDTYIYQTGYSMVQSLASAVIGDYGLVLLGGNAASASFYDSAQNPNLNTTQKLGYALVSGVFEALYEKVSLDKVIKPAEALGVKSFLMNILKSTFIEASEEWCTELSNQLAQMIVYQSESDFALAKAEFLATHSDATEAAAFGYAMGKLSQARIGAAIGGALSGGIMSGVGTGVNTAVQYGQAASTVNSYKKAGEATQLYEALKGINKTEGGTYGDNLSPDSTKGYTKALVQANRGFVLSSISDRLNSLGVTIEDAPRISEAIYRASNDYKLENGDKEILKSPNAKTVLSELSKGDSKWVNTMYNAIDALNTRQNPNPTKEERAESVEQARSNISIRNEASKDLLPNEKVTFAEEETEIPDVDILTQYATEKGMDLPTLTSDFEAYKAKTNLSASTYTKTLEYAEKAGKAGLRMSDVVRVMQTPLNKSMEERYNKGLSEYGKTDYVKEKRTAKYDAKFSYIDAETAEINHVHTVDTSKLNERQSAYRDVIKSVYAQFNTNVALFDGQGTSVQDGWYDPSTNTLYVDITAGSGTRQQMLRTFAHELTHSFKINSPETFKELKDFVLNYYYSKDENLVADAIASITNDYAKIQDLDLEAATEELVARCCERVFDDYDAIKTMAETNKGLFDKVHKFVNGMLDKLKNALSNLSGDNANKYAKVLDDEAVKHIRELFAKAAQESNDYVYKQAVQNLTDTGHEVKDGIVYSSVRFSGEQFYPKKMTRDTIAKSMSIYTGRSVEECKRFLSAEETMALNLKGTYMDFEGNELETAIKKNSDYPQGTIDLTNNCPKRMPVTQITNRLQSALPQDLFTADDYSDIRLILLEDGRVVACGLCFVEDRRQLLGEIAQEFMSELKTAISDKKVLMKTNAQGERKVVKIGEDVAERYNVPKGEIRFNKMPNINQSSFIDTNKWFDMQKNNPLLAAAFEAYNNARGQQSGRLMVDRAEYKREILRWNTAKVKKVNDAGGLRIFSFSDFEAIHMMDLVQIIMDCATMGVKIQGYTKQVDFVRLALKTGIKLNCSTIPYGATGLKLVDGKKVAALDTVEGIDINDPIIKEAVKSDDIGFNVTGINDEQIRVVMADDFFSYIIPFHTNKSNDQNRKLGVGNWTNYKPYQTEKYVGNVSDIKRLAKLTDTYRKTGMGDTAAFQQALKDIGKDITYEGVSEANMVNIYTDVLTDPNVTNERKFTEKFLEVCNEKGFVPRYSQFLNVDEDGNWLYTPGYAKMVVDFKLFDNNGNIVPQGNVTPDFDMEVMQDIVNKDMSKTPAEREGNVYPESLYENVLNYIKVKHGYKGDTKSYNEYKSLIDEQVEKINRDDDGTKGIAMVDGKYKIMRSARDSIVNEAISNIETELDTTDTNVVIEMTTDVINTFRFSYRDSVSDTKDSYKLIGKELMEYSEGDAKPDFTLVEVFNERTGKTETTIKFIGQKPANYVPKKIAYCYKLFEQHPDGTLHALFAGASNATPINEWVYSKGYPYTDDGVKGMNLRERYGWHLSAGLPSAPHLMSTKSFERGYPSKQAYGHPKGSKRVWVKMAYDASADFNSIADQTKAGDIFGLIPFGGYYAFKENNQSEWVISSAVKIDHILNEEERQQILKDAGYDEYEAWRKKHRATDAEKAENKRKSAENKKAKDKTIKAGLNYLSENSKTMRESIKSKIIDNPELNGVKYSTRDSDGNTLTTEQQEFFKDSKVRDEDGNLLVVYHGTPRSFNVFDTSFGSYFTSAENVAKGYSEGKHVIKSYLNLKKPFVYDAKGSYYSELIAPDDMMRDGSTYKPTTDEQAILDEFKPLRDELQTILNKPLTSDNFKTRREEVDKWYDAHPEYVNLSDEVSMIDRNELSYNEKHSKYISTDDLVEWVKGSKKYDGVIVNNVIEGWGLDTIANDYIIFNPEQAKQTANKSPTSNPDIRFSTRETPTFTSDTDDNIAKMVTFFSGAGTVDQKLKQMIDFLQQAAVVEMNPAISKAYALNEKGQVIGLGESLRVEDFLYKHDVKPGEIQVFHASPSCCNYSDLKRSNKHEVDDATAEATAKFIARALPKVFTLENVAAYRSSLAFKYITKALAENGYRFKIGIYQASHFGAAANRRRLLLVATRDGGTLTSTTPFATKSEGWYKAVRNFIPHLQEIPMAESIRQKLIEKGIDPSNPGDYYFINGKIQFKHLSVAPSSKPAPTFVASSSQYRILTPDGRCLKVTPKLVSKLMGLKDFKLPTNEELAFRVLGNGVSGELTSSVIAPMILENVYGKDVKKIDTSIEIDNAYVDAVNSGDIETATDLFNYYILNTAGADITPFLAPANYRSGSHSQIAKMLKEGDIEAVRSAAQEMAKLVPKNAVLVPIPSHYGDARDTKVLAKEIGRITKSPVVDALKGVERPSQYESKIKGKGLDVDEIGIYQNKNINEDKIPVFIDNVIASGTTASAAIRAVGRGVVLAYAYADRTKNAVALKSAKPITFDDKGNVIPLSQRFNKANPNVKYSQRSEEYGISEETYNKKMIGLYDRYMRYVNKAANDLKYNSNSNGYSDDSKSIRALKAEEQGKFPATKIADIFNTTATKVKETLYPSEWHHTSTMYNKTEYYDVSTLCEIAFDIESGYTREEIIDNYDSYDIENLEKLTGLKIMNIKYSERESDNAPTFYSQMGKVIDDMKINKIGSADVVHYLKGKGVKDEEIKWSGIETFLEGKKSVSKAELQEFAAGSMLQIEEENRSVDESQKITDLIEKETGIDWEQYCFEDVRGTNRIDYYVLSDRLDEAVDDGIVTKTRADELYHMMTDQKEPRWYGSEYNLDGGENYRELVFRLPKLDYSNNPMTAHWEESGVLAHARMQDMTTADGNNMLFIEEIQSDWHNAGKKNGYHDYKYVSMRNELDKLDSQYAITRSISNEDYARRRELRNVLRNITISEKAVPDAPFKDTYTDYVLKRLLRMASEQGYGSIGWTTADIQDQRWIDGKEHTPEEGVSGNLKGYTIEYDQDMPKFLNKYGKKWGGKVDKTELENGEIVWQFVIPESMKQSVLKEGQPMYSAREDTSITIPDGKLKSGKPVDFINLILDHKKLGETRNDGHLATGWVGIAKDGKVYGRVKLGKPIEITRSSPEYKNAYIANTDYDIPEGGSKWYYPILETEDWRDNPKSFERSNQRYGKIVNSARDTEYLDLAKNPEQNEARLREMVDKAAKDAGYNVKAYHGTTAGKFTVFRTNEINNNMGSHFGSKEIAEGFAKGRWGAGGNNGTVYSVYLKAQNPFVTYDWFGQDDYYPATVAKELADKIGTQEAYDIIDQIRNIDEDIAEVIDDRDALEEGYISEEDQEILYGGLRKLLVMGGYDSIQYDNGLEVLGDTNWVIQNSNQIKSADLITYDDSGNIIPLSERFKSNNDDIRNSMRDPDILEAQNKALQKTNDTLKATNEKLKEYIELQKSVTGGTVYTDASINRVAKNLANTNLVKQGMTNDIAELIKPVYAYIASNANINTDNIREVAQKAVDFIYDNYDYKPTRTSEAQAILGYLKNKRISVSDKVKSEIAYNFGSFNAWRSILMGTITYANDSLNLDSFWKEASERYPNIFDPSVTEAEQPLKLAEIIADMKVSYESDDYQNPAFESAIKEGIFQQIFEGYWDANPIQTITDKYEKALKEKDLKTANKLESAKEKLDNLRSEYKAKSAKMRADHWSDIAKLREKLEARRRNDLAAYRERVLERKGIEYYKPRIVKLTKELADIANGNGKIVMPEPFKAPVLALLANLDFTTKDANGNVKYNNSNWSKMELQQAFANLAKDNMTAETFLEKYGMDVPEQMHQWIRDISNWLDERVLDKEYNIANMSSDQLESLYNLLRSLKHAIKLASEMYMTQSMSIGTLGTETVQYLKTLGKRTDNKFINGIDKFFTWDQAQPYTVFKRFGKAGETIWHEWTLGQDKMGKNQQLILDWWDENIAKTKEISKALSKWREDTVEVEIGGDKKKIPIAFLMEFRCYCNQADSYRHLAEGFGIQFRDYESEKKTVVSDTMFLDFEDINNMLNALTPEQQAIADKMHKFITEQGAKWYNEISVRRFGVEEATTPDYYPITTVKSNDYEVQAKEETPTSLYAGLNKSWTKRRNINANNALIVGDIFETFSKHMGEMAAYNAYALPALDTIKWLNYQTRGNAEAMIQGENLQDAIRTAYGNMATKYIANFIKSANGKRGTGEEAALIKGAQMYNRVAVGANIRVAIQQPFSIVRAFDVIDPKWFGTFDKAAIHKERMANSGISQWKDQGYFGVNVSLSLLDKLAPKGDYKRIVDNITDKAMVLAEKGDEITWDAIWSACRNEVTSKNPELNDQALIDAINERFNEVIYATQVVDSVLAKSDWMRNPETLHKLTSSFKGEPTTTFNTLLRTIDNMRYTARTGGNVWQANKDKIAKTLTVFAITQIVNAAVTALIDAMRDDDDYETFWEKYWSAYKGNLWDNIEVLSSIPYAADIIEMLKGYDPSRPDMQVLQSLLKTGKSIESTVKNKSFNYKTVYNLVNSISMLSGIPLGNATRDVVSIYNTTIGALTGNRIQTYPDSNSSGYEAFYKAFKSGKMQRATALIAEMEDNGIKVNTMWQGLYKQVKEEYVDGKIAYADTVEYLAIVASMIGIPRTSTDINDLVEGWGYEAFYSAYKGGKTQKAAEWISLMQSNGATVTEMWKGLNKKVKSDYISGDINYNKAVEYLTKIASMIGYTQSESAIRQLINGWK